MTNTTRTADARTILDQIGPMTRASLGARDYVDLGNGVHFRIGGRTFRKAVVTLNASDLYDVQIVRMNRKTFETIVEHEASDVSADQLGEHLLVAHGKVSR